MSTLAAASSDQLRATFGYDASMPMAWLGGIMLTLAFSLHVFQYIHLKAWFLYLFLLGLAMELCGFWTRVVSIKQPDNGAAASSTFALTTIAPSILAAACYMTFGRIIYWVAPPENRTLKHILLPAKWVTLTFVALDMASFFISCIGAIVLYVNATKADLTDDQRVAGVMTAYSILRVSFGWQLVVFFLFTMFSLWFILHSKAWKYDWPESSATWRKFAWAVFASGALLTVCGLQGSVRIVADPLRADPFIGSWLFPSTTETTTSRPASGRSTCSTSCLSSVSLA